MKKRITNTAIIKFAIIHPIFTICLSGLILIVGSQFLLKEAQDCLTPVAIEMIGAFIIILIIELYLIRTWSLASYPKTKEKIYNRLTGVLRNLSLDIVSNYLKVFETDNKIIFNSEQLKKSLEKYNEANRKKIENKYISIDEVNIKIWSHKMDEYNETLNTFFKILPQIKTKDSDLSDMIEISVRITSINNELKKTLATRTKNKGFFYSDLYYLSLTIISVIDSGFYDSYTSQNNIYSIMERTND